MNRDRKEAALFGRHDSFCGWNTYREALLTEQWHTATRDTSRVSARISNAGTHFVKTLGCAENPFSAPLFSENPLLRTLRIGKGFPIKDRCEKGFSRQRAILHSPRGATVLGKRFQFAGTAPFSDSYSSGIMNRLARRVSFSAARVGVERG